MFYDHGSNTKTLEYYPTGELKSDVLSYNLTGCSRWYFESGQIKEEVNYLNGKRYGTHKKFYASGLLEFEGPYNGGYYNRGIKDGKWVYYDSTGTLIKTEVYRNDSLISRLEHLEQMKGNLSL